MKLEWTDVSNRPLYKGKIKNVHAANTEYGEILVYQFVNHSDLQSWYLVWGYRHISTFDLDVDNLESAKTKAIEVIKEKLEREILHLKEAIEYFS